MLYPLFVPLLISVHLSTAAVLPNSAIDDKTYGEKKSHNRRRISWPIQVGNFFGVGVKYWIFYRACSNYVDWDYSDDFYWRWNIIYLPPAISIFGVQPKRIEDYIFFDSLRTVKNKNGQIHINEGLVNLSCHIYDHTMHK